MSDEPPPSALQNPIRGTTIDTSEGELGLDVSQNESSASHSQTHTRVPSFSKSVIRRVEQTAAKIGSTVLGNHALSNSNSNTGPKKERGNSCSGAPAAPSSQQEQQREGSRLSASLSSADPRKFLSLSRKGKGRERDTTADNGMQSYYLEMYKPIGCYGTGGCLILVSPRWVNGRLLETPIVLAIVFRLEASFDVYGRRFPVHTTPIATSLASPAPNTRGIPRHGLCKF